MAIAKVKVRRWAYAIWMEHQMSVLMTTSTDGKKLEALISEYGELCVAYAWYTYVHGGDGIWYHTEAVKHIDEGRYKNSGKKFVIELEDTSAITRFPLAAFLAVPDGCIVAAQHEMAKPDWEEGSKHFLEILTKNPSQPKA